MMSSTSNDNIDLELDEYEESSQRTNNTLNTSTIDNFNSLAVRDVLSSSSRVYNNSSCNTPVLFKNTPGDEKEISIPVVSEILDDLEILKEKSMFSMLQNKYNNNSSDYNGALVITQNLIIEQLNKMINLRKLYNENKSNMLYKSDYFYSKFLLSKYKNELAALKLDIDNNNLSLIADVCNTYITFDLESSAYLNCISGNDYELQKSSIHDINLHTQIPKDSLKIMLDRVLKLSNDAVQEQQQSSISELKNDFIQSDSKSTNKKRKSTNLLDSKSEVLREPGYDSPSSFGSVKNDKLLYPNSSPNINCLQPIAGSVSKPESPILNLDVIDLTDDAMEEVKPVKIHQFSVKDLEFDEVENSASEKKSRRLLSIKTLSAAPACEVVTEPIILKPNQPGNVDNLTKVLTHNKFAVDNSMAGAGKTIMSLSVCQRLSEIPPSANVIVICPTGTMTEWRRQISLRGFPKTISVVLNGVQNIIENVVISYETLRSTASKTVSSGLCKHKLLAFKLVPHMNNFSKEEEMRTVFEATPHLKELIKTKTIFIFDEFHRMKNATSLQHAACSVISKEICNGDKNVPARILFLSATPFDKSIQVVGFLNAVNVIPNKYLVGPPLDINPAKYGLGEVVRLCYKIDPAVTTFVINERKRIPTIEADTIDNLMKRLPHEKSIACELVVSLYSKVLSKFFVSAAPSFKLPFELNIADGYFNISSLNGLTLYNCIQGLKTAYGKQQEEGFRNFGILIQWLIQIENAKVEIFVRKIHQLLIKEPNCKVLCFLNYHSTMTAVHDALRSLGVNSIYVRKGTTVSDREAMIAPIMEHNLNHRVLIGNTTVLGVGLNLDDNHGNFLRFCLISPSYLYMTLHQAAYRCYRANTKSAPRVRYVYGKVANVNGQIDKVDLVEAKLLRNMATKTAVMRSTLLQQLEVQEDVKFPGQHKPDRESDEYLQSDIQVYSKFVIAPNDSVREHADDSENATNESEYIKQKEAELIMLVSASDKDPGFAE